MKRFKFKFASIMRVRKLREEEALRHLGAAQRAFQQEVLRKNQLENDLKQSLLHREELSSHDRFIDLLDIQLEQKFIEGLKQRIIQAGQGITRASRGVEKALRVFLFARRQTRMMEMLYEKHYKEYRKAKNKKEMGILNELATSRAFFGGTERVTA